MISPPKWEPIDSSSIPADAITGDLRTQGNKLSLWQFDSVTDENINMVGLALASKRDDLAPIAITWADRETLSADVDFEVSLGDTPVHSLKSFHIDALNVDLERLSLIAKLFFESINNDNFKRLTRTEVKRLMIAAIQSDNLKAADLNEKLAKKVQA